jgi:hypothetical protein
MTLLPVDGIKAEASAKFVLQVFTNRRRLTVRAFTNLSRPVDYNSTSMQPDAVKRRI